MQEIIIGDFVGAAVARVAIVVSSEQTSSITNTNEDVSHIQIIHPRHSSRIAIRISPLGLRLSEKNLRVDGAFTRVSPVILACHGE